MSVITFLGTGSAFPSQSYNSCLFVRDEGMRLLVDAGGGNGILRRLAECGIDVRDIHDLFISHAHTDHILGAIWVIRAIINAYHAGTYGDCLNIYGNTATLDALDTICRLTLLESHYTDLTRLVRWHNTDSRPIGEIGGRVVHFFDVGSENVPQSGFRVTLSSGHTIAFLGDESLTERNADACRGADTVICGAFCRHADADIFHPYEKHHHTVRDVAIQAERTDVQTLILEHCEDRHPETRQDEYRAEAAEYFHGRVLVPVDGEVIEI